MGITHGHKTLLATCCHSKVNEWLRSNKKWSDIKVVAKRCIALHRLFIAGKADNKVQPP